MTVLKTSVRNFFAHKGRMALSAIAVLLSVAFVCGTLVFTDTMTATFDKLFGSTASDVTVSAKKVDDAQATGKPDILPASLQDRLAQVRGVASSVPDVTSEDVTVADAANKSISPSSGAPTIVSNWDPTETKAVALSSGHLPKGPTDAVLDADTAKKHHLKIGDTLRIIAAAGRLQGDPDRHRHLQDHQPRRGRPLRRHRHRAVQAARRHPRVHRLRPDRRQGRQRRPAQGRRQGGHRQPLHDRHGGRDQEEGQERRRQLPELHEVRDARLRRHLGPGRHLPHRQHLLDAGRPAHPRDRPDARPGLQPRARSTGRC